MTAEQKLRDLNILLPPPPAAVAAYQPWARTGDSLHRAATEKPDFWSVVGQTELTMLAAAARGQLADAEAELTASLRSLKQRVPAVWMWDSVYNEACFTLEPYLAMATVSERRCAQKLLEALKAMAA